MRVVGLLSKRFTYLKMFNLLMRKQLHINKNDAFTTCCILHNILLEDDGWLDEDLPHYPNGVKDCLGKIFIEDPRGEAMTNRGNDTTVDELMEVEEWRRCPNETKRLAFEWQAVMEKLVEHYELHALN